MISGLKINSPTLPQIDDNTIVVAKIPIPRPFLNTDMFFKILSTDEKSRADRYVFDVDYEKYIFCRGLLRVFLGQYMRLKPESIEFQYSSYGKPQLIKNRLKFNLSHTSDYLIIGCCYEAEIGIDVEEIRPLSMDIGMIAQNFSEREQDFIFSFDGEEQLNAFYHCWTRKEALLKGMGIGIGFGLELYKQKSILEDKFEMTFSTKTKKNIWSIKSMHLSDRHALAIAYLGKNYQLIEFEGFSELWLENN